MSALAAVLAGGRGSRIGAPSKPAVELGGRPPVAWPVAAALAAGLETVIVAKRSTPLPDAGVPVWHEPDEPTHPLAGVAAALERAGRPVLAIPCDMPHLDPTLLARLAAGPEAAVAGAPFPARFEPSALAALRAAAAAGGSVRATVAALGLAVVAIDDARMLASINTPAELAAAAAAGSLGPPDDVTTAAAP